MAASYSGSGSLSFDEFDESSPGPPAQSPPRQPAQSPPRQPAQSPPGQPAATEEEYDSHALDLTWHDYWEELEPAYTRVAEGHDIFQLKTIVKNSLPYFIRGRYADDKMKDLVNKFATEEQLRYAHQFDYRMDAMFKIIRSILEKCQRDMALMDISYHTAQKETKGKEGEELQKAVEKARRKMTDVIADLQATIEKQENLIAFMKDDRLYVRELEALVQAMQKKEQGMFNYDQDVPSEAEFMQDLQLRLDMEQNLNSSLREELEQERQVNNEVFNECFRVQSSRVHEQEERMREAASAKRELEILEGMRNGIIAKIKSLSANPDEVRKAVDEWMKATQQEIEEKKEMFQQVVQESRKLGFKMIEKQCEDEEKREIIQRLEKQIANLDKQKAVLIEQIENTVDQIGELTKASKDVETKLEKAENIATAISIAKEDVNSLLDQNKGLQEEIDDLQRQAQERSKRHKELTYMIYEEEPKPIPSMRYTRGLGIRKRGLDIRPLTPEQEAKLTPAMRERLPAMRERPTLPVDEKLHKELEKVQRPSPTLEKYFERMEESPVLSPVRTQTPPPQFLPSSPIPGIPPFKRALTPEQYQRVTPEFRESVSTEPKELFRSASPYDKYFEPMEGRSVQILDSPYQRPATPFVFDSPERSIPHISPGISEAPSQFNKTVILTSPTRAEPLLVNIDVDPKPLTYSENGENFICDISLKVQPGDHDILPQLPPASRGLFSEEHDRSLDRSDERTIVREDSPFIKGRLKRFRVHHRLFPDQKRHPPGVTPTTRRMVGPYQDWTPRGIFKRGQINIRRIMQEDRSPPRPSSRTSAFPRSNKSISWEKSPSAVIPGPSYADRIPQSDSIYSDFSDSPRSVFDTYLPEDRSGAFSDESGRLSRRSHESSRSPSPVIKRPPVSRNYSAYSDSPGSSRSLSPVIQRSPVSRYYSAYSDSPGSSRSPSPVIQRSPVSRHYSAYSDPSSPQSSIVRSFHGDQYSGISPLFSSPPSGYKSGYKLDLTGTPQSFRTQDIRNWRYDDEVQPKDPSNIDWQTHEIGRTSTPINQSLPHHRSYQQDDPFNMRMQLDDLLDRASRNAYSDYPSNIEWAPHEMRSTSTPRYRAQDPANIDWQTQEIGDTSTPINQPLSHHRGYQEDPFNMRMQLSELLDANRMPERN